MKGQEDRMINHLARVFAPLRLWQSDEPLPADFQPQFDLTPPLRPRVRATRPRRNTSDSSFNLAPDRISIGIGNVVALDIDAVVNVTGHDLMPLSYGLNAAIHHAAGPGLMAECRTLGPCPAGGVVVTRGHRMKAKWIVHAVPPTDGDIGYTERIAAYFRNMLRLAADVGATSLAVPDPIAATIGPASTARIVMREARNWCMVNARPRQIVFCTPDMQSLAAYRDCLAKAA
jgi:O-acetyl-ADP-ribose deacetylase (regulator of RNase III)